MQQPRNFLLEDVEINYPKIDPSRPVENPFQKGTFLWEMQIATSDPAKAQEMRDNHLPVKEKDGKFVVSVKRKVKKANGEDNGPVRVVNSDNTPFTAVNTIGNGSRANIILFQYPWNNMGRSGISSSLTAVQVTKHEVYTPTNTVEFSPVAGSVAPAASPEDAEATLESPF